MSLSSALEFLSRYDCINKKTPDTEEDRQKLREAILLVNRHSDYINLGICADNIDRGLTALASYLLALGYKFDDNRDGIDNFTDAVYIKYNTRKMSKYIDNYTGTYRGVLISCQSSEDNAGGTYGHFPLDLFI